MDDWRITVDFDDEGDGAQFVERLAALRLESAEKDRLGGRVAVSRSGARVFLYADTEDLARNTAAVVRGQVNGKATATLERWHPVEQEWKAADVPLPETEEEVQAERDRQQDREAAESAASGHAEWEVRVELPDHDATVAFADQLESEGFEVTRRFTFLLIGAANEDEANDLAARLEGEAPEGATIEVEPSGQMVWSVAPSNPFAIFGGLGI